MTENKSAFNWTFCQFLKRKTQFHEILIEKIAVVKDHEGLWPQIPKA
jgi:hypothetical protein